MTDTAWTMILGCVVIAIARVGDVSLGTLRMVAVVSGYRALAWLFGLMEMTIWVFAVSTVITHIRSEPAYGLAFAVGAATGNYVGVTLQRWLPFGRQVVRVFTREGDALLERLRAKGYVVTRFHGDGRDGPITMLFIQVRRADAMKVIRAARDADKRCFYTIDDIRVADAFG